MKSRRNFIQKSAAIGLGSGLISSIPNFLIAKDLKKNSPNETINFGVIGCKGQGWSNMRSILKTLIVLLCAMLMMMFLVKEVTIQKNLLEINQDFIKTTEKCLRTKT